MKILYVDIAPGLGGSHIGLQRLLSRLDRQAFVPAVVLSARNEAARRILEEGLGVPVTTVRTFTADTARRTFVIQQVRETPIGRWLRAGGPLGWLWIWGRTVRNFLTRTLPLVGRLYCAIRSHNPDLVHINDALYLSRAPIVAAWLAGKPTICHVRSLGPHNGIDRVLVHMLRGLVFMSSYIATDLAAQGIDITKGRVIYDGIDVTPFERAPDRATARATLGLPLDRPIVAVLGRLVPWKGQELFLRALRRVVDTATDVLGLVVGAPEVYSLAFEPQLHALAVELGLRDAVRFTGFIQDTPRLLVAIDVLAHTSTLPEPFGLVMLEAMAAGRPAVTPAEGGGLEIIEDGVSGQWYTPRDPEALAAAILTLLQDPDRAAAMGAAGRCRVIEQFNLDRHVAAVEQFYRELDLR